MLFLRERKDGSAEVEASLAPLAEGLGVYLTDLSVARHKGSLTIHATIFKKSGIGIDDCSRFHRAITAKLEIMFPETDIYIEVSSPGIERLIRDGRELSYYCGCRIKCYVGDDWIYGETVSVSETALSLNTDNGIKEIPLKIIAKAKLSVN